jgi:cytochrome c
MFWVIIPLLVEFRRCTWCHQLAGNGRRGVMSISRYSAPSLYMGGA